MADITESSSSDGSPASIVPSGDVTLDKDVDNKTLKQNLYDLKLRIYYMEQKNKYKEEDDGEGDIYQKYVDLQTELEKLKKHLDEKDELLLKAQKVTMYLREEKEKTLYEFQEKEKVYKENIQQLEKEVEEMKLRDPKFGLHTSALVMPGGDSVDCDSSSLYVSNVSKMQRNKIGELESQLNQLNMELESVKANNDQLEQTVFNLQRKINLSNKEITELNKELSTLHKERDLYADNCSKRDEILDKMEKQKLEISEKLSKVEQENESLRSALTCNAEENGSSKSNDKGTAVIIQRLLIENKKVNGRLRKVKEDLLQFYEQCSACPHCVNEKKLKKAPILKLQPAAGVADTEANSAASVASTSEDERYDKGSVGGGVASAESDNDGERDKYTDLGENEIKTLLRDKDELIARLKGELKKRTFNLQELVNKELWDKNREIEKLNKMSEKRKKENDLLRKQLTTTTTSGSGSGGVVCGDNRTSMIMGGSSSCGYGYSYGYAKQPCSPRNYKMLEEEKENISCMSDDVKLLKEHLRGCLEEKKALLDKINTLESRVAVGDQERRSQNSLVRNLRLECAKRNDDFEEAEKARKEAFNACALLTNRLEELACFLESLLAHDGDDDGGGFGINANKRQLLKQAIEKSREISKSFSCTFGYATLPANATKLQNSSVDLSVPILPDCSEINLSFSGGDDDDDEDEDENRDENDHDHRCIVVADCCGNDRRRRCRSRRIGGDSEDKSTDVFAASTEDSDAYDRAAGAISFVRSLNPNNELVFSKTGVRKLTNNHVTINCASTCVNNGDDGDGGEMQNSVTASSAIVSLDEAPAKVGDFDSESETWSEPDRNVSAARIGLTNSASKVHATAKRLRSAAAERRFNTDSDASSHTSVAAKKYPDAVDIKRLQKRIQHLENVNESLRKELQYSRLSPPSCLLDASVTADKKTDMEKLSEKTKLRNLLNKINLENCVDTNKYRDTVEGVRKHLRELCKHLAKTNELDKFVSLKLKEVCEHFELCELCCSRLNQQLEEAKTRNDVLAELLEETQSKFEQVMIELRATKLAYNSVILEHEQNIFKYKQCELTNEQLKQKLKSADELCRRLEEEQQQQQQQQQQRRRQRQNGNELTDSAGDADLLVDMLEKASKRIAQLELLVTCNDTTDEELRLCKRNVQELGEANERLLRDVQQLDAYKATIEEYRAQLAEYRENCEKLERELFEKERVEKLCRERCSELEAQLLEKDTLDRSLKLASQELREARSKMQRLEQRVDELAGELDETKENARLEHDRHAAELSGEKERNALLVRELRDNAQRELAEKSEAVAQLQQLVDVYDQRSRKFESEVQVLGGMLKACEEEKREFRAKIAQQMDEHENVKKEHEQKMKHLLSQIIAYRTEEESSLAAHRELVQQIEQAQNRKHTWKKTIREWQQKYEELKKEKRDVEERLLRFDSNDDGQSSGMAVTVCGSSSSTSADYKVHHLENIKCQLEKRVKELETANRELELRLKRLQNMKIMPSGDFEASSETETEADDGDESSRPTSCKNDGLATFYSSYSLPTSPNNGNKRAFATLLASSVPNSPTCSRKDAFVGTTTTSTTTTATTTTIGDDDHCDSVQHPHCIKFMPARRHQSENTATSPDLGIDSDHGRNSSSFEFDSGNGGETNIRCEIINLEEENKSLKRELGQTKKELEETLDKLTALNKNKKRMEKAIFKQIFETKHILKRARVNLEDVEATATATAAAPMSDDNVDANAAV